ncbi:MAG: two-component system response regulator DevR [Nonlabens sp.]|jgi:two-component system response regulator DevR
MGQQMGYEMDPQGPVRVMIVDDHEVVRHGLRALLDADDRLTVVAEAGSVGMAIQIAVADPPDVLVLDVRLPDGTGIEICREVRSRHPDVRALMLTSFADDDAVYEAIMAGAAGYLLKETRGVNLVEAVVRVAGGESLLDPAVTGRVLARIRAGDEEDPRLAQLTDQERNILALVATGLTNRAVGDELHLAEKTVKNYMSSVLRKLGMERRTEAAVFWAQTVGDD